MLILFDFYLQIYKIENDKFNQCEIEYKQKICLLVINIISI